MDGIVWAGFYGVSGDYYKVSSEGEPTGGHDACARGADRSPSVCGFQVNAEYGPYYKNSLLYLACVNLAELSTEELVARAHDLSLAALLADTIYNFGELVSIAEQSRGNFSCEPVSA